MLLVGKKRTTSRSGFYDACVSVYCVKEERRRGRRKIFYINPKLIISQTKEDVRESSTRESTRERRSDASVSLCVCACVRAHAHHGIHFLESKDVHMYMCERERESSTL